MLSRIMALTTVFVFLQGCVAVFIVGAIAGGAVIYDHRSIEQSAQDHSISYEVNSSINSSKELYNTCGKDKCNIEVATFNNVVLLIGQVPNEQVRQEAGQVASQVKHVEKVFNEIIVGEPASLSNETSDSWITTKVKSSLLATKSLDSGDLKVVTSNGIVYLMGVVTPSQAELASTTARRVEGVQKVVTLFQNPT